MFWSAPTLPTAPVVFAPGMIIEWFSGERSIVASEYEGVFIVYNVGSPLDDYTASLEYLQGNAAPTSVQPGQIYESPNYHYKVLGPEPRTGKSGEHRWACQIVGGNGTVYKLGDSAVRWLKRVDDVSAEPVKGHGPHTCPTCGKRGAQKMLRDVICMNPACTWFRPLP